MAVGGGLVGGLLIGGKVNLNYLRSGVSLHFMPAYLLTAGLVSEAMDGGDRGGGYGDGDGRDGGGGDYGGGDGDGGGDGGGD